ncbi:MAG: TrpR-like protein, YerC/YecD [Clostridia bacterium]|nr:TrpR-like protein, YerC/YecD [Clostridia bacterium]
MKNQKLDRNVEFLYRGILTLQNMEECRAFFEDLCTQSELLEMSRRLQAAKMLNDNYIYSDITEQTGLSTATISRVNRCLKFGDDDGYIAVLKKLAKNPR